MNGWFGLGWFGFGLGWVGFGFGLGWVGLVVLNECFRTTLAQHILSKLYSLSQHTHTHAHTDNTAHIRKTAVADSETTVLQKGWLRLRFHRLVWFVWLLMWLERIGTAVPDSCAPILAPGP